MSSFYGNGGGSSQGGASGDVLAEKMYICGVEEYDAATGLPSIDNPEEGMFYLVPLISEDENNLFNEFIYKNGNWEKFGSGGVSVNFDETPTAGSNNAVTSDGLNDYIMIVPGTGTGSAKMKGSSVASGNLAFAEGDGTTASGLQSHAEGSGTIASGPQSHAEGIGTKASNYHSHAEGSSTTASGSQSHAEGSSTKASGTSSHAEGAGTTAASDWSHAEGSSTKASGMSSHAEGQGGTFTLNNVQYISGAKDQASHSEGHQTAAEGTADHTEGYQTRTTSNTQPGNHAEGYRTAAIGGASHAEGNSTTASGYHSHAEGFNTIASGSESHAEGASTEASEKQSHAEGYQTTASGQRSHAEGTSTIASGITSHAEGASTTASGMNSHAEGAGTTASGIYSHAEGGGTTASGTASHAEGQGTIANHVSQHVFGEYNTADSSTATAIARGNYVEIVGNGTSETRSNARTLDWSGNEVLAGKLTVGAQPTENMDVATKQYVDQHSSSGGLQNLVDGSATGSVRGINSAVEDNSYTIGLNAFAEGIETKASGNYSHAEGGGTTASGSQSHAEGTNTTASGSQSHAEGNYTTASNTNSHAEGQNTRASGNSSHAEGDSTRASGDNSHAEGDSTTASGMYSHAEGSGGTFTLNDVQYTSGAKSTTSHSEGYQTVAAGMADHTEGYQTRTSSSGQSGKHAEGYQTAATGGASHAEGNNTTASGNQSHTEGSDTTASGGQSHAEGYNTTASNNQSHAEGAWTIASNLQSHAEGASTTASGTQSHAEGNSTIASGDYSHASGFYTVASGNGSYTEGNYNDLSGSNLTDYQMKLTGNANTLTYTYDELPPLFDIQANNQYFINNKLITVTALDTENNTIAINETLNTSNWTNQTVTVIIPTIASGQNSHAEGTWTTASGMNSHAEGDSTIASGQNSHAEGWGTIASRSYSHAEGAWTKASGYQSHAEGYQTTTSGTNSHAEGYNTTASGQDSHAEGSGTVASGNDSHAEGNGTTASGEYSHAEGYGTIANHQSQHIFGAFNVEDPSTAVATARGKYVEIVGNGASPLAKSNARTLDWLGNEVLAGKLTVGAQPTENMDVATKQYVDEHAGGLSSFDLSDRIAKGVDNQGNEVTGAIIEGLTEDITYMGVAFSANEASGMISHAEGAQTTASGMVSHSEGLNTVASGVSSHTEGTDTTSSGESSHAEGSSTTASGNRSHAEGSGTTASGMYSHAEGSSTIASAYASHAEGTYTIANHKSQHVFGEYNIEDLSENNSDLRGNYVEIVGNGDDNTRSNARTLDWNGNEILAGKLTVGSDPINNMDVTTKQYVDKIFTDSVKQALLNCFAHVAWTDGNGQTYYDALNQALYPINSISATFSQGSATIMEDDPLSNLKQYLTVNALYLDGHTEEVTDYTLSGELINSTSEITATYQGKTTTFNVTVTPVPVLNVNVGKGISYDTTQVVTNAKRCISDKVPFVNTTPIKVQWKENTDYRWALKNETAAGEMDSTGARWSPDMNSTQAQQDSSLDGWIFSGEEQTKQTSEPYASTSGYCRILFAPLAGMTADLPTTRPSGYMTITGTKYRLQAVES